VKEDVKESCEGQILCERDKMQKRQLFLNFFFSKKGGILANSERGMTRLCFFLFYTLLLIVLFIYFRVYFYY
jgi:hypothetical protein